MNSFRTRRPLLVNATQCLHHTLILTDAGKRQAYPGDWIIEGENRERYIVDNTFFPTHLCANRGGDSQRRPPLRQLSDASLSPNFI